MLKNPPLRFNISPRPVIREKSAKVLSATPFPRKLPLCQPPVRGQNDAKRWHRAIYTQKNLMQRVKQGSKMTKWTALFLQNTHKMKRCYSNINILIPWFIKYKHRWKYKNRWNHFVILSFSPPYNTRSVCYIHSRQIIFISFVSKR